MKETVTPTAPYPGLRPFEPEENHLFFGRDEQRIELLRRLRINRFLAVVGTSGSGKSSLVRAGLLPDLYDGFMAGGGSLWRIAVFRPGNDPIGNLANALDKPGVLRQKDDPGTHEMSFTRVTLRRCSLGLIEAVRYARLREGEKLLVVVDQFEELFRFKKNIQSAHSQDDAAAFVKLLLEASKQQDIPIYVVITMRSDFLGDCAQFRDLPEAINDGQYLIPRMTREQFRQAIASPAMVYEASLTPRLVNRLLNDIGDNQDQLPILQHALMRTWDHWQTNRRNGEAIDLHYYESIGGMDKALSLHADEAYNGLDAPQKAVAEKLFKCLTEKGPDNREIRRPATLREIAAIAGAQEKDVIAVIDTFRKPGRSFLMPPATDSLSHETLIDISHESLIRNWDRLKSWVNEEAESAKNYRRLAETATLYQEGKENLLRNPGLQITWTWYEQNKPNKPWAQRYHQGYDTAIGFLQKSKKENEAEVAEKETAFQRALQQAKDIAEVKVSLVREKEQLIIQLESALLERKNSL